MVDRFAHFQKIDFSYLLIIEGKFNSYDWQTVIADDFNTAHAVYADTLLLHVALYQLHHAALLGLAKTVLEQQHPLC